MQLYYISLNQAKVGRVLDGIHNVAGTMLHDEILNLRAEVFDVHIDSIANGGNVVKDLYSNLPPLRLKGQRHNKWICVGFIIILFVLACRTQTPTEAIGPIGPTFPASAVFCVV